MRLPACAAFDGLGDQSKPVVDGPGDEFPPAGMGVGDEFGALVGGAFPLVSVGEEPLRFDHGLPDVFRVDGVFVAGHTHRVRHLFGLVDR